MATRIFTWKNTAGSPADWTNTAKWDGNGGVGYPGSNSPSDTDTAIIPADTDPCYVNAAIQCHKVTISGNNSNWDVTLQDNLTVDNDLEIQTGVLVVDSYTLDVAVDLWVMGSGTLDAGTGTILVGDGFFNQTNLGGETTAGSHSIISGTSYNVVCSAYSNGGSAVDRLGVTYLPTSGGSFVVSGGQGFYTGGNFCIMGGSGYSCIYNQGGTVEIKFEDYLGTSTSGSLTFRYSTSEQSGFPASTGINNLNIYVGSGAGAGDNPGWLYLNYPLTISGNLLIGGYESSGNFATTSEGGNQYNLTIGGNTLLASGGTLHLSGGTNHQFCTGSYAVSVRGTGSTWGNIHCGTSTIDVNGEHFYAGSVYMASGCVLTGVDQCGESNAPASTLYISGSQGDAINATIDAKRWRWGTGTPNVMGASEVTMNGSYTWTYGVYEFYDLVSNDGQANELGGNITVTNNYRCKEGASLDPGSADFIVSGEATFMSGSTLIAGTGDHQFGCITVSSSATVNATAGTTILTGNVGSTNQEGYTWTPFYLRGTFEPNGGTFINRSDKGYIGYKATSEGPYSSFLPFYNFIIDFDGGASSHVQNTRIRILNDFTLSGAASEGSYGVYGLRNESSYDTTINGNMHLISSGGYGAPKLSRFDRVVVDGNITVGSDSLFLMPTSSAGGIKVGGSIFNYGIIGQAEDS